MADDDDVIMPLSLMRVGESAMATELASGNAITQESLAKRLVSEHALDESAALAVAQAIIRRFGDRQQKRTAQMTPAEVEHELAELRRYLEERERRGQS